MVRIGKEYNWEMSHRLPFHNGGCYNIHGHSYKMRIELSGYIDPNGMLLDYYSVDSIIRPILEEYDHALILDENDNLAIDLITKLKFKHKVLDCTSTSENLAAHFSERFIEHFAKFDNVFSLKVRVYETSDAFAEVTRDIRPIN